MNYLGMYILTKLDSWYSFTGCSGIVMIIAAGIILIESTISCYDCYEDFTESLKKVIKSLHVKTVFISGVVLLVFSQLLPTTKQAAFIYIAPQIIENGAVKDTVKNIPELTKLGTDYLKELLKEKVNDIKR